MIKLDKLYNKPLEIVTLNSFIPKEEIKKIKENIQGISENKATAVSNWRVSRVKWLPFDKPFDSLYQNIGKLIQDYNSNIWRFNLGSIINPFQYTEYHGSEEGKYNWHIDLGKENYASHRKLSISIQLSNPSEYEGGDLQIFNPILSNNINPSPETVPYQTISKEQGSIAIFPSFLLHRVTPVTSGIRKSLVLWVGSEPFK